jgi:hypothetical protein
MWSETPFLNWLGVVSMSNVPTFQTFIKKQMIQVKFLTTAEIDELRNRYKRKSVNGKTRTSAIQPKERKAFKYGITSETNYYRS